MSRIALTESCTEYFASVKEKQRKRTIFKKHRASAENSIQERILPGGMESLDDVKAVVDSFEADWKKDHSKVSSCFHSVCRTLDAHKAAFSLFPSSNEYVAAFSGAMKMVVQVRCRRNPQARDSETEKCLFNRHLFSTRRSQNIYRAQWQSCVRGPPSARDSFLWSERMR